MYDNSNKEQERNEITLIVLSLTRSVLFLWAPTRDWIADRVRCIEISARRKVANLHQLLAGNTCRPTVNQEIK